MKELISNPITRRITEQVIDPMSSKGNSAIGTIVTYYPDTNTADITITSQGTDRFARSVPILITNVNVKTIFYRDDKVVVLMLFNDEAFPMILGKIDETYYINTLEKTQSDIINIK